MNVISSHLLYWASELLKVFRHEIVDQRVQITGLNPPHTQNIGLPITLVPPLRGLLLLLAPIGDHLVDEAHQDPIPLVDTPIFDLLNALYLYNSLFILKIFYNFRNLPNSSLQLLNLFLLTNDLDIILDNLCLLFGEHNLVFLLILGQSLLHVV